MRHDLCPMAKRSARRAMPALCVLAAACGGGSSSPTPIPPLAQPPGGSWVLTADIDANDTVCNAFPVSSRRVVNAFVEPRDMVLTIGPGECAGRGDPLVETAGEVSAVLPAGNAYVLLRNPQDARRGFRLSVKY